MLKSVGFALVSIVFCSCLFAATPVVLQNQSIATLANSASRSFSLNQDAQSSFVPHQVSVDFKHIAHVRLVQMYQGYAVWGGDVIMHIPDGGKISAEQASQMLLSPSRYRNSTINGKMYRNLAQDLGKPAHYIFEKSQTEKALDTIIMQYQQATNTQQPVTHKTVSMIVFVDNKNLAHWAFFISFLTKTTNGLPTKPNYIIDAENFSVYKTWDGIESYATTNGGGFGGNSKMGKYVYDNLEGDYPALNVERDDVSGMCYLQNEEVLVQDARNNYSLAEYKCSDLNKEHNNLYWAGDFDAVNGAFSPSNDALFIGHVINEMYHTWYGVPALIKDGQPMQLVMRVHETDGARPLENAFWDGEVMTFGDGSNQFFPFVSLGIGAHEISHGFTEQHANLAYYAQSGGLNESFSDMAAQAAEFYVTQKNTWKIGAEVVKRKVGAFRYMDEPTRSCRGDLPGKYCPISHMKDYNDKLNVHYSSGIFNKAFYVLATTPGWDTKKAFDVMVRANEYYWTPVTTFAEAACGVMLAAKDLSFDPAAVLHAMKMVGVNADQCTI